MILSAWPIIPIILLVRFCYTLYMWPNFPDNDLAVEEKPRKNLIS